MQRAGAVIHRSRKAARHHKTPSGSLTVDAEIEPPTLAKQPIVKLQKAELPPADSSVWPKGSAFDVDAKTQKQPWGRFCVSRQFPNPYDGIDLRAHSALLKPWSAETAENAPITADEASSIADGLIAVCMANMADQGYRLYGRPGATSAYYHYDDAAQAYAERLTDTGFYHVTAYLEGSDMTLGQADGLYQRWMEALYPGQSFVMRISGIALQSAITHKKEVIVPEGTYQLTYQQVFGGVPVLWRISDAFRQGNAQIPALEEHLLNGGGNGDCAVTTQEDFSVRYRLYQAEAVLHEDVPLCSFGAVRAQLEQLIAEGTLREVRSAELGYVSFPTLDDAQTFLLMPMWVVHVRLMDKPTDELPPAMLTDPVAAAEYRTEHLFFSAQTGGMVDPGRRDALRCAPPEVIPW